MRKLFTTVMISLLAFTGLQAQHIIEVWGYVTDSNQAAMAQVDIHINAYTGGAVVHSNVVQTNNNGYYVDSFWTSTSQGALDVYIIDCHQDTIMERRFWSPNSTVFNIDFIGCGNPTGGGNCAAAFQYTVSANTASFLNFSNGSNLNYHWDFGDGHTSNQYQPAHTYNAVGHYLACLTVSNTHCSDTYCDTVVIDTIGGGCHAAFTYGVQQQTAYFHNQSTGTSSYHWDFGDGHSSTATNPSHFYANPGTYTVCLIATTPGTTCADTVCHVIQVSGGSNHFYSIGGFVLAGGTLADYATVYLIEMDSTPAGGISLTAIDTQNISAAHDSGYYYFHGLPAGGYLVKTALQPQSTQYANYMPTYYDTVLYWNQATMVVVGPDEPRADIHLLPGNNPGGPGFIGGLVSQGANKTAGPGDPIEGASVLLLTGQDEAVTHTVTNQDGEFSFDNLAYGTYKVRVEIAGKTSQVFYATIDGQNETIDDISFKVNKTDITTGIWNRPVENILNVTLYPNPAGEHLSISLGGKTDGAVDFRLVDIGGRTIMSQPALLGPNQNQVTLSLEDIPTGTYMVEIYLDDAPVYRTKLVRFK